MLEIGEKYLLWKVLSTFKLKLQEGTLGARPSLGISVKAGVIAVKSTILVRREHYFLGMKLLNMWCCVQKIYEIFDLCF